MKKYLLFLILLNSALHPSFAKTCSNWFNNPTVGSFISVVDLDIPENKITLEATINGTAPYVTFETDYTEGDVVSRHNSHNDANYYLSPNGAFITTSDGFFFTPAVCGIELNKTYHLAMVYDGSLLKFYKNGFLLSQVTATGNLFQNNWNKKFGLYDPSFWKTQFIGYINEIRIWNVARSQTQLRTYMNTSLPIPASQTGLQAYYTFDNLINKQGNNVFNGTLNGNAAFSQTNTSCSLIADSCAKIMTAHNGIGDIINTYTPVVALNPCDNKIIVEDASTFNPGDTVLIIQMKGAIIDSSNSASFGTILNYNNAGNYEFNYVKSKTGNVIELLDSITRSYDVPSGKVQLIRVPYYTNATVTSTLTCLPWDGSKGGVLVLIAKDSVNLNAKIDVTGKGFYGGKVNNPKSNSFYCHENDYYYPNDPIKAAPKGEAIAEISIFKSFGKGPIANGGGGGLEHNSGGGGGSNTGIGGTGGNEWVACGPALTNGGLGGRSINYSTTLNKIYLGGGGGGGHCDNIPGFNPDGGNGGGIVLVLTNVFKSNTFSILANGDNAVECFRDAQSYKCHEGMGGGGGGGTVLLQSKVYLDNLNIEIRGGKGADMNGELAGKLGPGGGGGGGLTWFADNTIPANIVITKNGGVNGVNIDFGNDSYGATGGQDGSTLFNLQIPNDTTIFKKNIDSLKIKDSAINCSTFNFKATAYTSKSAITQWSWNFGDGVTSSLQNPSHGYAQSGTYTATLLVTDKNGCTDSSKLAIVTVGGAIDFSYLQNVCNPLSVQFASIGAVPVNTEWSFGNGQSVTGSTNPTITYINPGTYTVKLKVPNGTCTDSITKNILITYLQDDIILTNDTTICFNTVKQLLTKPSLSFCWSPTTYLSDPTSASPTTSTTVPITYFFTAEVPGVNIIVNGDFNGGNTGFTSQYSFANPNVTEGQYFVGPSAQAWNNLMSNCAGHSGTGNMLLVNGASVPDVNVWAQTITVVPNTNYAFSTWIQSLYPPNPAQLSFSINGSNIGNTITATLPNCNWTQFYTTWNSGNNTVASIAIVNKNTEVQGNDFALDDISFSPVIIKRDSVKITIDTPFVKTNADTTICAGKPVQLTSIGAASYNWSPANGLNNAGIANPVATPVVTTQYIVTGTSSKGCTAADTVVISANPLPVITRTADTTICQNIPAQLWATGGVTYAWTPIASLSNAAIANPIASPVSNTIYHVTVTSINNCIALDSVSISIRPAAVFAVSPPDTTCFNTAVQLLASGGDTYLWSPAALVTNPNIANPSSAGNADAAYTVFIKENTCNTSNTLTTSLKVLPVPVISVSKSNDITCSLGSAQLVATGAGAYTWLPATALNNNTIANPVASPTATTLYVVTGTDPVTKCTTTSSINVFFKKEGEPKFFIPSAFSPNGDGKNDCFKVSHFNYLKSVDITIYNRFGNMVFHSTTDDNCWDGMYKGNPASPGNYVYYIKTENNCAIFYKKGNLLLIR